jgi:predicted ATP-grasp superfamily ATP-dependent carboligase
LSKIVDKASFYHNIKGVVPTPITVVPKNVDEVLGVQTDLVYPIVIKPRFSDFLSQKTGIKAVIVRSPNELKQKYLWISRFAPNPILQEFIPGPTRNTYGFTTIIGPDRRLCAKFMGRKIRENPPDLGTATIFESTSMPEIEYLGIKALRALDYFGPSEVEFRYDPRDDKFKILEINARGWMWIGLSTASGIDFPWILYCSFFGLPIPKEFTIKTGLFWIDLISDIDVIWRKWKAPHLRDRCAKTLDMFSLFISRKGHPAIFSIYDGLPFIYNIKNAWETIRHSYMADRR